MVDQGGLQHVHCGTIEHMLSHYSQSPSCINHKTPWLVSLINFKTVWQLKCTSHSGLWVPQGAFSVRKFIISNMVHLHISLDVGEHEGVEEGAEEGSSRFESDYCTD